MTHLITGLIGLLILVCTRRLYDRNFELFLCLLIIINFEFFSLLPRFSEHGIYREILLPIVLFYFLEDRFLVQLFPEYEREQFSFGKYGSWIIIYMAIVALGIGVASFRGQPILLGIKAAKYYPLFLVYFIIVNHKIDINKFTRYFVILCCVLAALIGIQWVFFNKLELFYFYEDANLLRTGADTGLRIIVGAQFISISAVIAFAKYLKSRSKTYLCVFIGLFSTVIIIIQTRAAIIAILITTFFLFLNDRKFLIKRLAIGLYAIVFLSSLVVYCEAYHPGLLARSRMVRITMENLQDLEDKTKGGSVYLRKKCYEYYFGEARKSILIGHGICNFTWEGNPEAWRQKVLGFYLSDIGIMHLLYDSGLAGLLWFLAGLIRFIPDAVQANQYQEVGAYFVLGAIMMPTIDLFISLNNIFLFGIFLALMAKVVVVSPKDDEVIWSSKNGHPVKQL